MDKIKQATLFGGSGPDRETKEYKETVLIGSLLAQEGYLVKNGGYGGMMEAVSKGVVMQGGGAIGITCKQVGTEKGNEFLTQTIVTNTLFERLAYLIEDTDIFIVQKGGIGTLSEVFLSLDIIRKDSASNRPKMFFIGSFWNTVIAELKIALIPDYEHELFKVVKDFEEFKVCMLKE